MRGALIAFQKCDGHTYIHTYVQLHIPGPQSVIQCLVLMRSAIKLCTLITREVSKREEELKEDAKKKHMQDDEDNLRKLYAWLYFCIADICTYCFMAIIDSYVIQVRIAC